MKKIFIYALPAIALSVASCADGYEGDLKIDKPESVEHAERLASLGTLNTSINRSVNPNFKLGLAVASGDFASHCLTYSLAATNFDFVTDASAMEYAKIYTEDGAYNLKPVTDMVIENGPMVIASSMLAYNALPKSYLDNLISPTFVKGDLATGTFLATDFEEDEQGKSFPMNNGSISTVTPNPSGVEGNVLQVGSKDKKARNSYAELTIDLPDALTVGNLTTIVFDLYCPDDKSRKRNFVALVNGIRKNFVGDTPEKRGCPLAQWMNKVKLDITDMKLTDDVKSATQLKVSFGPNVNNSYYFIDNVQFEWTTGVSDMYVDKTESEKAEVLTDNFSNWAEAIMKQCAPNVSDYVVLSKPMSDKAPYALRSSETEAEVDENGKIVNDMSGMFFFNDYMGDNYVKTVTDCLLKSYQSSGGQGTPNFFVSESGLVGNTPKAESLVSQIKAWSSAGAKIDGIAVEMNNLEANVATRQYVTSLFTTLATSGKQIRIDNLSVANGDAEFYGFLIKEYFRLIKAENRAGILFASPSDLWKDNMRTDAYEAVFNAILDN